MGDQDDENPSVASVNWDFGHLTEKSWFEIIQPSDEAEDRNSPARSPISERPSWYLEMGFFMLSSGR